MGDAFGYPVEFMDLDSILARYRHGLQAPLADPRTGILVVSDDTQMTMFTLEGLLLATYAHHEHENMLDSIRLAYLDWLATQGEGAGSGRNCGALRHEKCLCHRRAPGNTCLSALKAGGRGSPERAINDSKGCGGGMRVGPIGLLRQLCTERVFDLAARAAALTHGHPSGYLSAGILAGIIRLLLDGYSVRESAERALELLRAWPGHEETLLSVHGALRASQEPYGRPADVETLGGGWVGEEALAIGLYAALVGDDFVQVMGIAATHSSDSDSTASIAGQLWGAAHGVMALPESLAEKLDVFVPLDGLTTAFLAHQADDGQGGQT